MIVGIPKEIMHDEARVAAIPDTVKKMVAAGMTVLFEKGAGEGSHYHDKDYLAAGATILEDCEEIFAKSDVILKVKEPLFNEEKGKHEIEMMHKGQYIITFIHPASPVNHKMVKDMAAAGVIGLTLDGVPRISRAQSMDALSSMSTCAGYKGMLMGANDISKFMPLIGSAVGVIQPANVLVIGTGVAGLRAVATAKGLGAKVYSADIRPSANEQAMSLGAKIVPTGVPEEIIAQRLGGIVDIHLSVADRNRLSRQSDDALDKLLLLVVRIIENNDVIPLRIALYISKAVTEDLVSGHNRVFHGRRWDSCVDDNDLLHKNNDCHDNSFSWFCFFLFVVFSAHNPSPVKCSPCKIRRTDDGRGAVKVFPDRSDKVPVSSGNTAFHEWRSWYFSPYFSRKRRLNSASPYFVSPASG